MRPIRAACLLAQLHFLAGRPFRAEAWVLTIVTLHKLTWGQA